MPTELILKKVATMGETWRKLFDELRIYMGKERAFEYLLEVRRKAGINA